MKQRLLTAILIVTTIGAKAQAPGSDRMQSFVDALMKKMTLDEKIGQLNLPGAGDIPTGQAGSSDIGKTISEGKIGGLFNIKSVTKIRDVQKVAVGQSRLK